MTNHLNQAPFEVAGRRTLLLTDREFSLFGSKTAVCYLRYRGNDVVAVVDSRQAGRTAGEVVGVGGDVPVVATVADAPTADLAVIGIAPRGGRLTAALRLDVAWCLENGVDVASGLHDLLGNDATLAGVAGAAGARIWDVRAVPSIKSIATGVGCTTGAKTVLLVGSDCNVGKMTATVELFDAAARRGLSAAWAATGQTGIMLRGRGIAIDHVLADFMSGAVEELVNYEGRDANLVFVEGQGSLVHPGFSGVALALLHGTMPDAMVLVHAAGRESIGDSDVPMPALRHLIDLHETALLPHRRSRVVALALNTARLGERDAREYADAVRDETGLPATDPVRFGAGPLLDAVLDEIEGNDQPR